jgi:hypothetical protein
MNCVTRDPAGPCDGNALDSGSGSDAMAAECQLDRLPLRRDELLEAERSGHGII